MQSDGLGVIVLTLLLLQSLLETLCVNCHSFNDGPYNESVYVSKEKIIGPGVKHRLPKSTSGTLLQPKNYAKASEETEKIPHQSKYN